MLIRIQHRERRQSFGDVLRFELLLAADDDSCLFAVYAFDHPLETDLLEVEDDVLHTFDDAGDVCEFLVDTGNAYLADGKTFKRCKENATKGVAYGLAVTRLKGAEFETSESLGTFEHDNLVRFLEC